MTVGESIYEYRRKSGLTQKQLADRLYVSVDLVSKWECGSRRPDYSTIMKLAEVFGTDVGSIIDAGRLMMDELKQCVPDDTTVSDLPDILSAFITELTERDRSIFVLRYYFFEDIKSIAIQNGISEINVRVILFRTRSKLGKYIRRYNYENQ